MIQLYSTINTDKTDKEINCMKKIFAVVVTVLAFVALFSKRKKDEE